MPAPALLALASRRSARATVLAAGVLAATAATAQATPVGYGYAIAGTATLPTLTKSAVPLAGSASGRLDPATGAFGTDLTLAPATVTLASSGGVGASAKIVVTPVSPFAGSLTGGILTLTGRARVRLTSITTFGIPLVPADTCQSTVPSNVILRSTAASFDPAAGGTVSGTFAIGNLSGCAGAAGVVNTATAVAGNAVTLQLRPTAAPAVRYSDQVFTGVTITDGVQYGQAPGADGVTPERLLLDIYQPTGDTLAARPAIVWMHGGGFGAGDRKEGLVSELARRFARRGYVTVSIDYRLLASTLCGGAASADTCSEAALSAADDEGAAVRYLRANAAALRIDTDHIAVGGDSAGAVSSILVGANGRMTGDSGNPGYPTKTQGVVSISGGVPTNLVFHSTSTPMLFWHGTTDTVVPYSWAVSNAAALANQGVYSVMHSVQGAGHVPVSYIDDMDAQARDFLYRVLSLHAAVGGGFPR